MTDQDRYNIRLDKDRRRKGLLLITAVIVLWVIYAVYDMDKPDYTPSLSKDLEFTIGLNMWDQPENPFGDWVVAHNRYLTGLATERDCECE